MKTRDAKSEEFRIAAHFVKRDQSVVDVKYCILQPLGHERAGVLLQAHEKRTPAFYFFAAPQLFLQYAFFN